MSFSPQKINRKIKIENRKREDVKIFQTKDYTTFSEIFFRCKVVYE